MDESSHCAEFANRQDQNEACADAPKASAETMLHHSWSQTTIEDFYREGMGVAGKE